MIFADSRPFRSIGLFLRNCEEIRGGMIDEEKATTIETDAVVIGYAIGVPIG